MQSQGQRFVVWGRNRGIWVHGWGRGVGLGFGFRGAEPELEARSPESQGLDRGVRAPGIGQGSEVSDSSAEPFIRSYEE